MTQPNAGIESVLLLADRTDGVIYPFAAKAGWALTPTVPNQPVVDEDEKIQFMVGTSEPIYTVSVSDIMSKDLGENIYNAQINNGDRLEFLRVKGPRVFSGISEVTNFTKDFPVPGILTVNYEATISGPARFGRTAFPKQVVTKGQSASARTHRIATTDDPYLLVKRVATETLAIPNLLFIVYSLDNGATGVKINYNFPSGSAADAANVTSGNTVQVTQMVADEPAWNAQATASGKKAGTFVVTVDGPTNAASAEVMAVVVYG